MFQREPLSLRARRNAQRFILFSVSKIPDDSLEILFADGSTRDQQYTKISIDVDQILPKENHFIYIQILNVISLGEFYALIPAFFTTNPHSLTAEINKRPKNYKQIKNIFGENLKLNQNEQLVLFSIHGSIQVSSIWFLFVTRIRSSTEQR